MSEKVYSRRHLLVGAGATGSAGALALLRSQRSSGAPAGPPPGTHFSDAAGAGVGGVIESIESAFEVVLRTPEGNRIRVRFADDAEFWRDRPARLRDFSRGEEVVVEGEWAEDESIFRGTGLINMYVPLRATVLGVSGARITTTAGIVRVVHESRHQRRDGLVPAFGRDFVPGQTIEATARIEPGSGDYVALRFYEGD